MRKATSSMKAKIEGIANIAVILLAVAVGTFYLKDRFFSYEPIANQIVGAPFPTVVAKTW
jgi:hypothetical protein